MFTRNITYTTYEDTTKYIKSEIVLLPVEDKPKEES